MVHLYCKGVHGGGAPPCPDCRRLIEYSELRLDRCRFGEKKPVCSACPVHCYAPGMRESIRKVMRFSGPRMVFSHPLLAFCHILDRMAHFPS